MAFSEDSNRTPFLAFGFVADNSVDGRFFFYLVRSTWNPLEGGKKEVEFLNY